MPYYVYIMTNKRNTVLYTGITNDLARRVYEHKNHIFENSFTKRYNVCKLVFCESFNDVNEAIAAEKKIKGWTRARKFELINNNNPSWKDLSEE